MIAADIEVEKIGDRSVRQSVGNVTQCTANDRTYRGGFEAYGTAPEPSGQNAHDKKREPGQQIGRDWITGTQKAECNTAIISEHQIEEWKNIYPILKLCLIT